MRVRNQKSLGAPRGYEINHGFTLIEILIVVSIIIMLAGLVVAAGMFVQKLVMLKQTENMINQIKLATVSYSSDYREQYPPSHQSIGMNDDCVDGRGKCGIQALCSYIFYNRTLADLVNKDGLNKSAKLLGKPDHYARPKDFRNRVVVFKTGVQDNEVDYLVDSWGTPLFYFTPGSRFRNPSSCDIWSAGPDRQSSTKIFEGATEKYDYHAPENWPVEFSGGAMIKATGPTGTPNEITGFGNTVPGDVNDQKEATWDDVGNFKRLKDT